MHIRAGMIAHMCAYTYVNDCVHVCIHAWACLRLCVHIHAGMMAPMCTYTCRHDCAYVARGFVGMKLLRTDKTRLNEGIQAPSKIHKTAAKPCHRQHTCSISTHTQLTSNIAGGLVRMKILRADRTRPNGINLKGLTLCMHIRVKACL